MPKTLTRSVLLAFGALISVSAAYAQAPAAPRGFSPAGPLTVTPLSPTVYWGKGAGGNFGFIVGDKGVIVIDATISAASAKELLADIAKVTPKPVTTVILTHRDIDHVGGLAGFPSGIEVIAQENTQKAMAAGVAAGHSPVPADRLPNHTVATREDTQLDGVKVELLHWAPAHTDGDLVIYLPEQRIVFTGDIFCLDQPRALIHLEEQGSSSGWITTADGVLGLDADRFVVGHGDVQTKAGIQDRVNLVTGEKKQIESLVAQGKTLAEVETIVGDPPKTDAPAAPGPHFTPFAEVVYQELTASK